MKTVLDHFLENNFSWKINKREINKIDIERILSFRKSLSMLISNWMFLNFQIKVSLNFTEKEDYLAKSRLLIIDYRKLLSASRCLACALNLG